MKTRIFNSISTLLFILSLLASCQQDESLDQGTEQEEEQVIESASVSEDASDDALEMSALAETQLTAVGGKAEHDLCAEITHDVLNNKIIVDFGDGCVGPYGRERRGKIIITYSGEIGDSIANRIITFENYFVNNKGVTGTIELRDIAINAEGNLQCTKRLIDLTITYPNGVSVVFNGNRVREWIAGAGDDNRFNNLYRITGRVTGVWCNGRTFTHEIVEPIIADWSCAEKGNFARVAGVVEVTKLGGYKDRKRTVDYGDGECDNVIEITTFRRSYSVVVKD
jgi:hypothetical protein